MAGTPRKRKISQNLPHPVGPEIGESEYPIGQERFASTTMVDMIHELRLHQIELEIQNEELKLAHIELELSRDRYVELYDFAPAGYFTLTDCAIVTEVNLFGADLLGILRQKLQGARFRQFVSPSHIDLWDRFFVNLVSQDIKLVGNFLLIRSSGPEMFARIEGSRKMAGNSFQVRIIVQDITDQKETQEGISLLAQMVDKAPASILVHDFDGNLLYANEETFRLHGYTREEFLAKNLHEIDIPDSEELIGARMHRILIDGEAVFEVSHNRKDGSVFPLQVYGKVVSWAGRQVILSISTDLSEKKHLEKMLVESEERYQSLMHSIPRSLSSARM